MFALILAGLLAAPAVPRTLRLDYFHTGTAVGKPKRKLLLAELRRSTAGSPATVIFAQGLVQKSLEPGKASERRETL